MTDSRRNLVLVLRELIARRASGVLAVSLPDATGEVRFQGGVVEDVVLGRADGAKALVRMLAGDDLRLAFREAREGWLRRIEAPSDELVADAERRANALKKARAPFDVRRESHVIGVELGESTGALLSSAARALWSKLRSPTSFLEVFDLSSEDDATVVETLAELDAAGAIRWLELASDRQPLGIGGYDATRLRERYGERARIAVAGTLHRVAVFTHALLHVDDVIRPPRDAPLVPMPHVVATVPLDGIAIDVVALPLVPAYQPLWSLALADVVVAVRLDEAAPGLLEAVAALTGVRVAPAEALVGELDEGRVGAVAALVRAALLDVPADV